MTAHKVLQIETTEEILLQNLYRIIDMIKKHQKIIVLAECDSYVEKIAQKLDNAHLKKIKDIAVLQWLENKCMFLNGYLEIFARSHNHISVSEERNIKQEIMELIDFIDQKLST